MTSILASIPRILARSGRQTAIGTDAAELHKAVSAVLDTGSNSLVLQEASSFSFADNVAELQDTCTHGAELVDNSNEQSKGATARLLWEQTTRLLTRIANEDAAQRRTYLRRQQDRLGSLVRAAVCIRSVLQHQEAALSLQNGRSDNQCDDERDHDPRLFRLMSQQHVCDLLEDVILDVDMLTLEKYGVLPTISLEPCPRSEHRDARVPAQPLLLKYILTEIIKNAAGDAYCLYPSFFVSPLSFHLIDLSHFVFVIQLLCSSGMASTQILRRLSLSLSKLTDCSQYPYLMQVYIHLLSNYNLTSMSPSYPSYLFSVLSLPFPLICHLSFFLYLSLTSHTYTHRHRHVSTDPARRLQVVLHIRQGRA